MIVSYFVIKEISVTDLNPFCHIIMNGDDDVIPNIKSVRAISDHHGGVERYVVHTRGPLVKAEPFWPEEKVKIKVKLKDVLKDL